MGGDCVSVVEIGQAVLRHLSVRVGFWKLNGGVSRSRNGLPREIFVLFVLTTASDHFHTRGSLL